MTEQVTLKEAAERWGVSVTRATVYASTEGFPEPARIMAGTRVYEWPAIDAWRTNNVGPTGVRRKQE